MILHSPFISGGVRWYIQWGKVSELNEIRIEKIINEIIPIVERAGWSQESVKRMKKVACPLKIPMLMVQTAVIEEVGKPFCEATYILDRNYPLGVCCWMVFENLNRYVDGGIQLAEKTINIFNRAAELIQVERNKLQEEKADNIFTL